MLSSRGFPKLLGRSCGCHGWSTNVSQLEKGVCMFVRPGFLTKDSL